MVKYLHAAKRSPFAQEDSRHHETLIYRQILQTQDTSRRTLAFLN